VRGSTARKEIHWTTKKKEESDGQHNRRAKTQQRVQRIVTEERPYPEKRDTFQEKRGQIPLAIAHPKEKGVEREK